MCAIDGFINAMDVFFATFMLLRKLLDGSRVPSAHRSGSVRAPLGCRSPSSEV